MNGDAQRAMTATEWSLLLLLSLMWGGSFFFVGVAVKALPPFTIVAARVSIAAALLWFAASLTGVSLARLRAAAPALAALAFLNNVAPFSLLTWSQTHLASGLVSILNATTPVFTVVVAHLFTVEEKLDPRRLVGALIGLAGVAAMIGPALLGGFADHLVAELAALLAALSYAAASVFARRFRRLGLTPIDVATGQVTASSLVLLPLAALVDAPWRLPAPDGATIAAIVAIGALSTALAYVIYFRILAGAGATNVVLVTLLAPATAILLGAAVLGESLAARDFVGLGLIALGLAVIDGRLPAAARARLTAADRRLDRERSATPQPPGRAIGSPLRRRAWRLSATIPATLLDAPRNGADGAPTTGQTRISGGANPTVCRARWRAPRRANCSSAIPKRPT